MNTTSFIVGLVFVRVLKMMISPIVSNMRNTGLSTPAGLNCIIAFSPMCMRHKPLSRGGAFYLYFSSMLAAFLCLIPILLGKVEFLFFLGSLLYRNVIFISEGVKLYK